MSAHGVPTLFNRRALRPWRQLFSAIIAAWLASTALGRASWGDGAAGHGRPSPLHGGFVPIATRKRQVPRLPRRSPHGLGRLDP